MNTIISYGFDTTFFPNKKAWENVCFAADLEYAGRNARNNNAFVWAGKGVVVETTANPITGEYIRPEMRAPQEGFADHIGITGTPEKVYVTKAFILAEAEFYKDHSEGRQYI